MQPHRGSSDVSDEQFFFVFFFIDAPTWICSKYLESIYFRGINGMVFLFFYFFIHCVCHHVTISLGLAFRLHMMNNLILQVCFYMHFYTREVLLWIKSSYWSFTDTTEALSSKSILLSLTRHNIDRLSIFYILHLLMKQYRFSNSQS